MQVLFGHFGKQFVERDRFLFGRLDDQFAIFQCHLNIGAIFQPHFLDKGLGNPHGVTVAPFLDGCFHEKISCIYNDDTGDLEIWQDRHARSLPAPFTLQVSAGR